MTLRSRDLVNSQTITEGPSSLQNRYEYNADSTVLYTGYATKGAAVGDDVWTIHKFTYVNQLVTVKQTAFDTWSNRANATYE